MLGSITSRANSSSIPAPPSGAATSWRISSSSTISMVPCPAGQPNRSCCRGQWADPYQQAVARGPRRSRSLAHVEWLPKYAPELNDIEAVWHDLKAHHLAHQIFTDSAALHQAIPTQPSKTSTVSEWSVRWPSHESLLSLPRHRAHEAPQAWRPRCNCWQYCLQLAGRRRRLGGAYPSG
jgi:hypothetical protein